MKKEILSSTPGVPDQVWRSKNTVKQVDKNFFIASWYAYGILSKKGAMEIWKRK